MRWRAGKPHKRWREKRRSRPASAADIQQQIREFYKAHGVSPSFPQKVERFAKALNPADKARRRCDLRHLNVFTIDPKEARDFDDAFSVEIHNSGKCTIGVHIADVSHWVKQNGIVDKEAEKRGNSFYFPWGFVPMLPQSLTSDICSLVPDQDRLAVTSLFQIDGEAITDWQVCCSLIESKKRLTYQEAQDILGDPDTAGEVWLRQALGILHKTAQVLRAKRFQRGGMNFAIPEFKAVTNAQGRVESLQKVPVLETHRIVEDWMLETNERMAAYLSKKGVSFLYRNHPKPNASDLDDFHGLCRSLDLKPRGKDLSARYRSAFAELGERPNSSVFNRLLVRAMPKALYESKNRGHFGIGAGCYAHFTSPIRRYPDLTVHRALKQVLRADDGRPTGKKRKQALGKQASNIRSLGRHCMEREVEAMKMEREAYKWMACRFMEGREYEEFKGVISGVAHFGLFVELLDIPVEGMLLRRSLPRDTYRYDEEALALIGLRSKVRYTIGQEVDVILKRCDPERRQIDFVLAGQVEESGFGRRRFRPKRA